MCDTPIPAIPKHSDVVSCQQVADRAAMMPQSCEATYLRAADGTGSPRNAIKAFCQMCMGWEGYQRAIRQCTDPACPLYPYRPYQE